MRYTMLRLRMFPAMIRINPVKSFLLLLTLVLAMFYFIPDYKPDVDEHYIVSTFEADGKSILVERNRRNEETVYETIVLDRMPKIENGVFRQVSTSDASMIVLFFLVVSAIVFVAALITDGIDGKEVFAAAAVTILESEIENGILHYTIYGRLLCTVSVDGVTEFAYKIRDAERSLEKLGRIAMIERLPKWKSAEAKRNDRIDEILV